MGGEQGLADRAKRALDRVAPARFGGRLGLGVVALGLVVIGIGWNGAAGSGGEINHVPVLQAQLPWILSGGFLGLGIVVLGAALVIVSAQRESSARLKSSLDAIAEALVDMGGVRTVPDDLDDLVVSGSSSYHRSDCRLAQDRSEARLLTVQQALDSGLSPCRVCNPPVSASAPR